MLVIMQMMFVRVAVIVCCGLVLMTGCQTKKELTNSVPIAETSSSGEINNTIGAVLIAPVTIKVTTTVSKKMQKQQEALVKGWAMMEIQENSNDTLVAFGLVRDMNKLDAIKLGLDENILFKIGSADLSPKAEMFLSVFANNLIKFPDTDATIIGYASHTGSENLNKNLSIHRAQSVKSFLIGQGVPEGRLKAIGKGWDNPVASNTTTAGRAKNRRVEVWVTANEHMIKKAR